MGIAPVFAVPKLLNRCACVLNDIDLWELNEAFRCPGHLLPRPPGIDPEKLNVTVARSPSVIHSDDRFRACPAPSPRNGPAKARYGVVTMCIGGGQGAAALFETAQLKHPIAGYRSLGQRDYILHWTSCGIRFDGRAGSQWEFSFSSVMRRLRP